MANPDRFRELAARSEIAALVLGRADSVRFLYLHQTPDSARPEIEAAIREGFSYVGLIGVTKDAGIVSESEPGFECLMDMARIDFSQALFAMRAVLPAA